MSIAPLTVEPIPDELLRSWIEPLRDPGVRRDLVHFLRAISRSDTLDAAERLRDFERPALLDLGPARSLLPAHRGRAARRDAPDARLETVENARTFVQLDAPERVAELIVGFAAAARRSRR